MPLRSVMSIDVESGSFDRFYELFQTYQAELKRMPAGWQQAGQHIQGGTVALEAATAAMMAQAKLSRELAAEQQKAAVATKAQESSWKKMAEHAKATAGHVMAIGRGALRLGGELLGGAGLFGGLASIGGLFGLARLAQMGGDARRSTMGLGLTFGEQQAFRLSFGRVVNPGSFLEGISGALSDVTRRVPLAALGLNPPSGADTAQVGAEALMRIKRLVDRTPTQFLAQIQQAYRLDELGLGLDDLRRLKATPGGEIASYRQEWNIERQKLSISTKQLKVWQDLQYTLARSRVEIERTFLDVLGGRLAPAVGHLSRAFTAATKAFLESQPVHDIIDKLASGLDSLATYFQSDQFEKDFTKFEANFSKATKLFSDDMIQAGRAALNAFEWAIGKETGKAAPAWEQWLLPWVPFDPGTMRKEFGTGPNGEPNLWERLRKWYENIPTNHGANRNAPPSWWPDWAPGGKDPLFGPKSGPSSPIFQHWWKQPRLDPYSPRAPGPLPPPSSPAPQNRVGMLPSVPPAERWGRNLLPGTQFASLESFASLEKWAGLPRNLLDSVWAAESARGRFMRSRAGALGHFQFMPSTWRMYEPWRGASPFDLHASAIAASRYLHKLLSEFHGNVAQAVAAYNWGEGHVERDIRKWGENWWRHLPRETEHYLEKILPHLGRVAPASPAAPMHTVHPRRQNPATVQIAIHNATGGSAVVAASQLAV